MEWLSGGAKEDHGPSLTPPLHHSATPLLRIPQTRSEHPKLVPLEAEFALGLVDGDLVMPAPAGGAVVVAALAHAGEQPVEREVGEAVHLEELADLLDGPAVGDQLFAGGEVDPVKARVADRGAGDAEVDLLRPRPA